MTNVLIADDSGIVRKLLRKRIQDILRGYQVNFLEASDGQEAYDALISKEIQLALIDYNMPEMTGVEVIKKFKAAGTDKKPYMFMITTEASSEIVMEAIKAGAHNYLVKNKIDAVFVNKIKSILMQENDD